MNFLVRVAPKIRLVIEAEPDWSRSICQAIGIFGEKPINEFIFINHGRFGIGRERKFFLLARQFRKESSAKIVGTALAHIAVALLVGRHIPIDWDREQNSGLVLFGDLN